MRLDDDFSDLLHENRSEKIRPLFKVIAVIVVLVGLGIGGLWLYGNNASKRAVTEDSYNTSITPSSNTIEDSGNDATEKDNQHGSSVERVATSTNQSAETKQNSIKNEQSTSTKKSSYDPNKCKSLENNYQNLKTSSDSNYANFNEAMSSAKNWGDLYEQNGRNKALTDIAYSEQQARIEGLQQKWKDSLDDQNNAYDSFLKCQAKNY